MKCVYVREKEEGRDMVRSSGKYVVASNAK